MIRFFRTLFLLAGLVTADQASAVSVSTNVSDTNGKNWSVTLDDTLVSGPSSVPNYPFSGNGNPISWTYQNGGTLAEGNPFNSNNGWFVNLRLGTIILNATGNALSFVWGSVDSYNSISFFKGSTKFLDISGDYLRNSFSPIFNANAADGVTPKSVQFSISSSDVSQSFDRVDFVLAPTTGGFEFGNIVATPTWNAGTGLPALVGFGLFVRFWRRKTCSAAPMKVA